MNWYIQAFRNYPKLNGFARRSDYWYFTLITVVVIIGVYLVDERIEAYSP